MPVRVKLQASATSSLSHGGKSHQRQLWQRNFDPRGLRGGFLGSPQPPRKECLLACNNKPPQLPSVSRDFTLRC